MEQVIFGGEYTTCPTVGSKYNCLTGAFAWAAGENSVKTVVSTSGVIKNLRVVLNLSPGGGKHYDFTLMLNGAPSALTLEIADAATSGHDEHEIDVVAGDIVSLRCTADSTPTARYATWTIMFEGATANESLILGNGSIVSKTATEYSPPMGVGNLDITENNHRQICPTAGVIKNLYVELDVDPGDVGVDGYRFTLRLNKATVAQSLIVLITANDKTGNDVAHNLVVAAGDVLTMMVEPINAPASFVRGWWGMTFVADTDGESIVLSGSAEDLNNSATRYHYLQTAGAGSWTADEIQRYQLGQECTIKKLYVLLSGSPGVGNKYDFTIRVAGGDSNVTVEIAGGDTTGNSGVLEDTVADDEYVDLKCVPDSSPSVRDAYWGLVCYIHVPVNYEESAIVNVGVDVSKVRLLGITRASSVLIGNLVTASRLLGIIRLSSVLIGNLVSALKSWNRTETSSVLIGNLVSAVKIWGVVKSASVNIGNLVSASRLLGIIRLSSVLIGVLVTATKIWGVAKSSLVLIGNKVSAIRLWGVIRLSGVLIGNKVSAIRLLAIIRNSSVLIGNKVTASGLVAYIRASSVLIGNLVTASRAIGITRDSLVLIGNLVSAVRLLGIIRASEVSVGVLVSAFKTWNHLVISAVLIGVRVTVFYCTWLKKLMRVPISRIPLFRRIRSCK